MEILKQAPWSRIRGQKKREQRSPGDCWQWKANGQCSKGDSCSFRHEINKRAKTTPPKPSPRSSAQQNVKNASGNKSGKMARLPCKDYFKGTRTTPFCEKMASSRVVVLHDRKKGCKLGEKGSYAHRQVDEQPSKKSLKRMVTKLQWLY